MDSYNIKNELSKGIKNLINDLEPFVKSVRIIGSYAVF